MNAAPGSDGRRVPGRVVEGHGVASGLAGDPRFPEGTIRLQLPQFAARGVDLSRFHPGTVNVSIAPRRWELVAPDHTLRDVRWHDEAPPEDFSFVRIRFVGPDGTPHPAMVYLPHPDTKPDHAQPDDVVEVLAPHVPGLSVGDDVVLVVDPEAITIE